MTRHAAKKVTIESDPGWYHDAVVYQIHVRAFCDSNGDGIGDFQGLASRLDYIRDLGVTAIWLLPFYPSPLRDDGYDIADYSRVHPAYGTLSDFKLFLREAHKRGLRVITELVLNHTSDQHPWFQRARRAPRGSRHRDYYVWSDTYDKYTEARVIFKDFESSNWTWDPVAGAYYWHRFYSHQPDLNFDNPAVFEAMKRVMDFWLELGVDGLRLDAVPYLYEREGTNCENLPETHAALRRLRTHVDATYGDRMLLAEANQWPEDAVAYFGQGDGDECHMAFHFPLMPRMFMALRMEDRYPIIDILQQTPPLPTTSQWAIFLRNHDELTLEMVTDEERDYMYRVYASESQARINLGIRRRLAPLLGNDRRSIELMNGLLFSLPGTPVLYYGDEIGMGDNIYLGDRNGVRTPMQWTADRNAGFSQANPQKLYLPAIIDPDFSYEAVNVQTQLDNPHSLLRWMRRLIWHRKRFDCLGRGSLEFLYPANNKVLAFIRRQEQQDLLVVANLSRYAQYVELDLSAYRERVPVEVFGQVEFPRIGELPYLLTLAPHTFYWFALEARQATAPDVTGETTTPVALQVKGGWLATFKGRSRGTFEQALPRFLLSHRWFGGKARRIKSVELQEVIPLGDGHATCCFTLVKVDYRDGESEGYALPLSFASGDQVAEVREAYPHAIVAEVEVDGEPGVVYGAVRDPRFAELLIRAIAGRRRFKGAEGELLATPTRAFRRAAGPDAARLQATLSGAEQSNSSIVYGDRLILKLIRRAEPGTHPELEIGRHLSERSSFAHVPPLAGHLEYRPRRGEGVTLGILQGFVPSQGDAWRYTLDNVERYLETVSPTEPPPAPTVSATLLAAAEGDRVVSDQERVGPYLEAARLIGQRTGELHIALASDAGDPAFAPEPFSPFYQRSLYQSMRNLTEQNLGLLREKLPGLPEELRDLAEKGHGQRSALLRRFRAILDQRIAGRRTRIHGDYHLGQLIFTGRDFVILDFEGEPARPLSTRRLKRSPLRDVAGMVRSFDYAVHQGLRNHAVRSGVRHEELGGYLPWARHWYREVASTFLGAYLETAGSQPFLPQARDELSGLLTVYLLERTVYELGYELNNRPEWIHLPLQGLLHLMEAEA
jgi:maltose alpha-D-glucosyltransferase/alpha-amylase